MTSRACYSAQALCFAFTMLLAACGGGGGGGSSAPDPSTAPGLTVSPASISFTAVQNGAIPPTQNIQITISRPDAVAIAVGFPLSVTPPTWLDQSPNRFSCTPSLSNCTLTAAILTTSPAPGTYTTTIRVAIADASHNILALRDVQMNYTIQPLAGLAANPQTLSFNQLQGAPTPAAQSLGISELGGASYAWNASIVYQSGSGWLHVNGVSSASGATLPTSLSISVNGPGTLGTLNAIVRVTGNGNTLDVPVSYALSEPTLTRSPAQLTFNAPSTGTLPATQNVTLSTQQNLSLGFSTSISYGTGATGWLSAPANGIAPGSISIGTNTTNLVPGTYTATLTLTTAVQTVPIGITYVVATSSLTFSPASPSFTIDTTSLASALRQNVTVGSTGVALSWTAGSNQPWLSVSPLSGTSGTPVTLTLIPEQLDTLDAGSHTAAAVFNYTPPNQSLTSASLSISLNLQIPKVNSVNPYVATSGRSVEVILRGSGFNNTAGAAVNFGSTTVTSYNALSDTELLLAHPSLPAGSYRVSFANHLGNPGIVRSTADLVVVDAPSYAATTIAYPNATTKQPLDIIYDAERQTLLVGVVYPTPGSSGEIFRYPFTGPLWGTPTSASMTSFRDLALSLDGKNLIAVSDFVIAQIDSATLTTGTLTDTLVFEEFFKSVAMANDGNAVLTTGFPPVARASTSPWLYRVREANVSLGGGIGVIRGIAGSSADGSLVILSHASPDSTPSYIGQYDSRSGRFSFIQSSTPGMPSTWPRTLIRPKLDRRATRLVLNGYIVIKNSDYSHLSLLPPVAQEASAAVALSPEGTRAYQYVSGTLLRTFDVSSSDQSVSEIGAGTVLPSDPGANPVMTVSPDGGTLFIAGSDGIVVVPAP